MNYQDFLKSKQMQRKAEGFKPIWLPDCLFDFQRHLVDWAIRLGRSAIWADCGLGKTIIQLVWAENVTRKTNKRVLILTPLAVSSQTVREGNKFGIEVFRVSDGKVSKGKLIVTNYERLHLFDPSDFVAVVCDESSILKNFDGRRRKDITEFLKSIPYRLLCTATAAPNDYIELGTSSEALGKMGNMDMLSQFFKHDDDTIHARDRYKGFQQMKWRFKAHAEEPFWRWVCSWAKACRKPSDLGFSDDKFILPKLIINEHTIKDDRPVIGRFFRKRPQTLNEQREEARRTLQPRCEEVARLASHKKPVISWCHLNAEGDLLNELIPDAEQVSGSDSDDRKEELFEAFTAGQLRVIITKPKIGGFGLNWQHCSHQTFFPTHSYEAMYQCVRRSYRFGQKHDVKIDMVTSEGLSGVTKNLKRKADQADKMFAALVRNMNSSIDVAFGSYGDNSPEVPTWL